MSDTGVNISNMAEGTHALVAGSRDRLFQTGRQGCVTGLRPGVGVQLFTTLQSKGRVDGG